MEGTARSGHSRRKRNTSKDHHRRINGHKRGAHNSRQQHSKRRHRRRSCNHHRPRTHSNSNCTCRCNCSSSNCYSSSNCINSNSRSINSCTRCTRPFPAAPLRCHTHTARIISPCRPRTRTRMAMRHSSSRRPTSPPPTRRIPLPRSTACKRVPLHPSLSPLVQQSHGRHSRSRLHLRIVSRHRRWQRGIRSTYCSHSAHTHIRRTQKHTH